MTANNAIKLVQPGTFTGSLTDILRNGARTSLAQAIEAVVTDYVGRNGDLLQQLILRLARSQRILGPSSIADVEVCSAGA